MDCKTNDIGQDKYVQAFYFISVYFDINAPKDV